MNKNVRLIGFLTSVLAVVLMGSIVLPAAAEDKKNQAALAELMAKAPRVFLDGRGLDRDFVRQEIAFVNYVRDRKDADVHVLVTNQPTGSGGREYNLAFVGQGDYADLNFTLKYFSNRTDVSDEVRKGMARALKKGLLPFVARTPLADLVDVVYDQASAAPAAAVKDKWNYWIFSLNASGDASGVKTRKAGRFEGNLSANRVTEAWKIRLGLNAQFDGSRYDIDGETYKSSTERESFNGQAIRSLGAHWSAGFWLSLNSASYNNIKFSYSPSVAVEYSFFPYAEATRRQLYLQYRLSYSGLYYHEVTIYDKMEERLFRQTLSLNLELIQPWGNAAASIRGSHYLHDIDLNRLELYGSLSFRIFKGFSFWAGGGYSAIHDQISLPAVGATLDQILLMRKDQATTFSFRFNLGLSFTFGSMYSNVVNPRFD
jgi:hypothetical protein